MSQNNAFANKVEQEYAEIVTNNAWPRVYQKIGLESQLLRHTWNDAKKPENKSLNRYRDVNPYDHTRVILKRSETDYINANFVTRYALPGMMTTSMENLVKIGRAVSEELAHKRFTLVV